MRVAIDRDPLQWECNVAHWRVLLIKTLIKPLLEFTAEVSRQANIDPTFLNQLLTSPAKEVVPGLTKPVVRRGSVLGQWVSVVFSTSPVVFCRTPG